MNNYLMLFFYSLDFETLLHIFRTDCIISKDKILLFVKPFKGFWKLGCFFFSDEHQFLASIASVNEIFILVPHCTSKGQPLSNINRRPSYCMNCNRSSENHIFYANVFLLFTNSRDRQKILKPDNTSTKSTNIYRYQDWSLL